MSMRLACELSARIAAVGSVTGSIFPLTLSSCNAVHPTPVLQIHGTADATVPYTGAPGWTHPVPLLISHWATFNNCDAAITTTMPDLSVIDGSTVEKSEYLNGDNCAEVVHYKILNGAHTWPGSVFNFPGTNYDIDASIEVWKFVSRYDINGMINCTSIGVTENEINTSIEILPNPSNKIINVNGAKSQSNYSIVTVIGQEVMSGVLQSETVQIDISSLPSNVYLLKIEDQVFRIVKAD